MKIRKLFAILLVLSMVAALFCGCGADVSLGKEDAAGYNALEDSTVAAADESLSSGNTSTQTALPANQKLIRTVTLDAETENMDALLTDVESRVAQLGGYIENRNVYNGKNSRRDSRWANLTIRVPADKLDQFVSQVSGISNVVSHSENTKDVTLSYVATESRITALQTEEARLLELLAVAKDLKDLLILEEKLTDVRTELERHKSQLKVYDNQVNYATVHLSVEEVVKYTVVEEEEPTVWERISNGFVKSLKGVGTIITELFIFFVVASPYLAIPAAVVVIVLVCLHRSKKKAQQKQVENQQNQ
jgi:hypothetical protein